MIEPPAAPHSPTKPRPLATGRQWGASLAALAIAGGGIVGLRFWDDWAWSNYAEVRSGYDQALSEATKWSTALESSLRNADNLHTVSSLVAESAADYVEDDLVGALQASDASFAEVVTGARSHANWSEPPLRSFSENAILWEVLGESAQLSETAEQLRAESDLLSHTTKTLNDENDSFENDVVSFINEVGSAGQSALARYPSATNDSYRELKTAADLAASHTSVDARSAGLVDRVIEQTDAVASSHAAKEAAKAGPLAARRNEIESFARSIAGGVRIDFTWKDVVIGHGQGRSAAGTATWDTADTGYSSVTLTNSIARYWTEWAGYRSLVAHEIGHSITSKCHDAFAEGPFGDNNERWATAWAIGMGYTVSAANGSDLYGAPTAAQINATKSCR